MSSFEKKIEMLQHKPLRERKIIALVSTSVVFIILVMILTFSGAFSLSRGNSGTTDFFNMVGREMTATFGETGERVSSLVASATPMIQDIQQLIASSTASTSLDNLGTSTSFLNDIVGTTTEDGSVEEESTSTDIGIEDPVSE